MCAYRLPMDPATRRWMFIALLIAAVGLAACVVRTTPTRHRHQQVQTHEKHKKHKHKKHKKHRGH